MFLSLYYNKYMLINYNKISRKIFEVQPMPEGAPLIFMTDNNLCEHKRRTSSTATTTGTNNSECLDCGKLVLNTHTHINPNNIFKSLSNETMNDDLELLSTDEFKKELIENLDTFIINMKSLNFEPTTFPEWFETFMHWSEVNTDMEEECYGPRKQPKII